MSTNLCQARKMCLFLVIADGFLSSIVRKALHLHCLIMVIIGENYNKMNYVPIKKLCNCQSHEVSFTHRYTRLTNHASKI